VREIETPGGFVPDITAVGLASLHLPMGMQQVLQKKKDAADRALEVVVKARNDYRARMNKELESMRKSQQ